MEKISSEILELYQYDVQKFINNYTVFINFLSSIKISRDEFIKYAFSHNYDWLNDILKIVNNNQLEEFINIKDYFFKKYYFKDSSNMSNVAIIKSFINILNNYSKYPKLCKNILIDDKLNKYSIELINFLFLNNFNYENIDTLYDLELVIKNNVLINLKDINNKSIYEIKEIISKTLFNDSFSNIVLLLSIYGNSKDLYQLKCNNKNNNSFHNYIDIMSSCVKLIENITFSNDRDYLINLCSIIQDNLDLAMKYILLFSQLKNKMYKLYETDLKKNLTHIDLNKNINVLLDKNMSLKHGIDVIDLSDKKYCLLAHVKSTNESIEEIVTGESKNKIVISFSAISDRNQVYYARGVEIIFGYDNIPDNSFIQSSISNMGSNAKIMKNSFIVRDINSRRQRGIIEVSSTLDKNSEVLCYRESLKPKYIILPGGRCASIKEIDIAKKYNLKFIKTQKLNTCISNPQNISDDLLYKEDSKTENFDYQLLLDIEKLLLNSKDYDKDKLKLIKKN